MKWIHYGEVLNLYHLHELGSDWPKQVEPRFDERKAILFDDRWASAREDLSRAYYDNDASALDGSFIGLGKAVADEAAWYAGKTADAELPPRSSAWPARRSSRRTNPPKQAVSQAISPS